MRAPLSLSAASADGPRRRLGWMQPEVMDRGKKLTPKMSRVREQGQAPSNSESRALSYGVRKPRYGPMKTCVPWKTVMSPSKSSTSGGTPSALRSGWIATSGANSTQPRNPS